MLLLACSGPLFGAFCSSWLIVCCAQGCFPDMMSGSNQRDEPPAPPNSANKPTKKQRRKMFTDFLEGWCAIEKPAEESVDEKTRFLDALKVAHPELVAEVGPNLLSRYDTCDKSAGAFGTQLCVAVSCSLSEDDLVPVYRLASWFGNYLDGVLKNQPTEMSRKMASQQKARKRATATARAAARGNEASSIANVSSVWACAT